MYNHIIILIANRQVYVEAVLLPNSEEEEGGIVLVPAVAVMLKTMCFWMH